MLELTFDFADFQIAGSIKIDLGKVGKNPKNSRFDLICQCISYGAIYSPLGHNYFTFFLYFQKFENKEILKR